MLPTNKDNKACNPLSSDCVIWQGPEIPCINLCPGDSVTTVVYNLATQLCTIFDELDLKNYDLSCLSLCPSPTDFKNLIQILINKICQLEGCCNDIDPPTPAGCPDCVVNIAPCFYFKNPQGDTVTTMQLKDYVIAIGNQICSILSQLGLHGTTLVNHENRITALERTPAPTFQLPQQVPVCVLSPQLTPIDQILQALEQQFCQLRTATGVPNDIFRSLTYQCNGLTTDERLGGEGSMGSIPGWVGTVQDLAGSFTNAWLTICDLRSAVRQIQQTCCPSGCAGLVLSLQAVLVNSTTMKLYFTGTIPVGFLQCTPSTQVTITDTNGASIIITVNLQAIVNDPSGFVVDLSGTPLNPNLNFTITCEPCFNGDDIQCQKFLQFVLANSLVCPDPVTLTSGSNSINFSFLHTGTTITYTVQLYDASGTVLIAAQVFPETIPTTVTGTFMGLTGSTDYKFRIVMTSGGATNSCPFQVVTTQPDNCPAPSNVTSNITIP